MHKPTIDNITLSLKEMTEEIDIRLQCCTQEIQDKNDHTDT